MRNASSSAGRARSSKSAPFAWSLRHKKLLGGLLVIGIVILTSANPVIRHVTALRLLLQMKNEDRSVPPLPGKEVSGLRLASGESFRARSYGPPPEKARISIVLGHGIHFRGIEEPRLIRFSHHLADLGCHVLTPELKDLTRYQVTRQGVDVLGASVRSLHGRARRVGLIGFSFAGGLGLLAGTDPQLARELEYVASIGGYLDLERTLRFLATSEVTTPEGTLPRKAHEYGLLVLLGEHLPAFSLGADEIPFRKALTAWLQEDRSQARSFARELKTDRGRELFSQIEEQRLHVQRDFFLKLIEAKASELQQLSTAGRLAQIETQVLLLHGSGDSVVPPEETLFGARELRLSGKAHIALSTPLLEHVRVEDDAGLGEKWQLVHLMAQLF